MNDYQVEQPISFYRREYNQKNPNKNKKKEQMNNILNQLLI